MRREADSGTHFRNGACQLFAIPRFHLRILLSYVSGFGTCNLAPGVSH